MFVYTYFGAVVETVTQSRVCDNVVNQVNVSTVKAVDLFHVILHMK
jgi:hypothetical protein